MAILLVLLAILFLNTVFWYKYTTSQRQRENLTEVRERLTKLIEERKKA